MRKLLAPVLVVALAATAVVAVSATGASSSAAPTDGGRAPWRRMRRHPQPPRRQPRAPSGSCCAT
jgi:hypothetical protein